MIGGDTKVCGALLEHLQHRVQHANHGASGLIRTLGEPAQAIEVPEELVGAVNEVNEHGGGGVGASSAARAHDLGRFAL